MTYVLSNKADSDLNGIYAYSCRTFGEAKADAYFLNLCDCLQALTDNPRLGRSADHILPGLLRYEHANHSIFFMIEEGGIFVIRILHQAMDTEGHIGYDKT